MTNKTYLIKLQQIDFTLTLMQNTLIWFILPLWIFSQYYNLD